MGREGWAMKGYPTREAAEAAGIAEWAAAAVAGLTAERDEWRLNAQRARSERDTARMECAAREQWIREATEMMSANRVITDAEHAKRIAAEAERDAARSEPSQFRSRDGQNYGRPAYAVMAERAGDRQLQAKYTDKPPFEWDEQEVVHAILQALNAEGVYAWDGDGTRIVAQMVHAQFRRWKAALASWSGASKFALDENARADMAEAKFSVLTASVVQETVMREAAEARLADLARLAEAYRAVQLEAVAHHRRCANCQGGQACDEAGSILDEMAKRRAPFWRELDRALGV